MTRDLFKGLLLRNIREGETSWSPSGIRTLYHVVSRHMPYCRTSTQDQNLPWKLSGRREWAASLQSPSSGWRRSGGGSPPWPRSSRSSSQHPVRSCKQKLNLNTVVVGGPHSTVDSDLASHPAALGLILCIPKFFLRTSMLPGFIDRTLLKESGQCKA